jgi:PAS domain S-box-containing protein
MYDQAYFCVIATDTQGKITRVNRGALQLLGYPSEEELTGKNLIDLLSNADLQLEVQVLKQKVTGHDLLGFHILRVHALFEPERILRLRVQKKDRAVIPTVTIFVPVQDENSELQGFLSVSHDITQQLNVEKALEESEENFRIMTENNPVLLWKSDVEGKRNYFNQTYYEYTGLAEAQAMDDGWIESVHPEDRARYFEIYEQSFQKRIPYRAEFRLRHNDGSYRWVLGVARPRYNASGDFLGYIGSTVDIHSQKEMMKVLEQTTQKALLAEKAERKFVTNMSHEIRTPITGILGMADLMSELNMPSEARDYLADIQISAKNLLELVNNVLDFSKIQAGKVSNELAPFDLYDKVSEVVKPFYFFANQKKIDLGIEIAPDVPRFIRSSPAKIGQVLTNFLGNAHKFTHQGGVKILVNMIEREDNEAVLRFAVKDSGIGIAPDRVLEIFRPFVQGDSSITRKYGGTGLGLTICKEFVENLQGEIGVNSKEDDGSEFWFMIPVEIVAEKDVGAKTAVIPAGRNHKAAHLLLVEDNLINQKIAVKLLQGRGHHVDVAHDGAEAVAKLKNGPFDLVLMDCQMPVMDGYQATREIREKLHSEVPIVAMTAHALKGDREKCLAAGMNDYLTKPLDKEQLFQTIEMWLAKEKKPEDAMLSRLKLIEKEHGADLLKELIGLFLTDYSSKMTAMERAARTGDVSQVKYFAHLFRSGSANLGAQRLAEMCLDLEEKAGNMGPGPLLDSAQSVVKEYQTISRKISQIQNQLH